MINFRSLRNSRGFTLLEALIAMVILAGGLIAIAQFQASLVSSSGYNKARAEALALAQQKLDRIRRYRNLTDLAEALNPDLTTDGTETFYTVLDGTYPSTQETIVGTNADFSRSWQIVHDVAQSGTPPVYALTKKIVVNVSWEDPSTGQTSTVALETEISWADPSLAAALAIEDRGALVPSATGAARLGDGHYGTIPSGATSNDDGTYTYKNMTTGNVELIDLDGNIVLTLEDACNTHDGTNVVCTDFVKISGLIFFDESDIGIDDIAILASDAAYCAERQDDVVDTGDYNYYAYTCYLGGAWHGNIGVVQFTNQVRDICVGDPDSDIDEPKIAMRRVYRGMLSRDFDNDLEVDDAGSDGIKDYDSIGIADALVLPNPYNDEINTYYDDYTHTIGSVTRNYLPGHNYFIAELGNDPDDVDCYEASDGSPIRMLDAENYLTLTASDSTTISLNAFKGSPDDFQCFNQVHQYASKDKDNADITALVTNYNFYDTRLEDGYIEPDNDQIKHYEAIIDASGNFVLAIDSIEVADASGNVSSTNIVNVSGDHFMDTIGCPFDPSDPPSEHDYLKGSLYYSDSTTIPKSGFVVNTSDDMVQGVAGNCTVTLRDAVGDATTYDTSPDSRVFADYSCDFYHSYDSTSSTGQGWTGNVVITAREGYGCTPETYSFTTELTADTGNQSGVPDFTAQGDTGYTSTKGLDFICGYTGPTGTDLVTLVSLAAGGDSSPLEGSTVQFEIKVINNGPEDATGITLTTSIPTGLSSIVGTPDTGIYASNVWSISYLASGSTATLTLTGTLDANLVDDPITGTNLPSSPLVLSATAASGDQSDISTSGDDLTEEIIPTTSSTANLVTEKILLSDTNPAVGDDVIYQITVTNLGGGNVSNVQLDEDFDNKFAYDPAHASTNFGTDSNGTANTFDGTTWTIPVLFADDSTTLVVGGTLSPGANGEIPNLVTPATSPSLPDPSNINDDLTESVSVSSGTDADLYTQITVDNAGPTDGSTITYTITVTNNGPSDVSGATLTVDPGSVTGLSYVTASDTINYNSGTGLWTIGTIASGGSATLTIDVLVGDGASMLTQPIRVVTTQAVATDGSTDPYLQELADIDGALYKDITVTSAVISSSTVVGTISYHTTGSTVTLMTLKAVNASTNQPETDANYIVTCPVTSSGTAFDCTVPFDPAVHDGVVFEFTGAAICSYNAKVTGTLGWNSNGTMYWIDAIAATHTLVSPIIAADAANQCP